MNDDTVETTENITSTNTTDNYSDFDSESELTKLQCDLSEPATWPRVTGKSGAI